MFGMLPDGWPTFAFGWKCGSASGQKFAYMNGQSVQKYVVPLTGGVQAVYNASGFWYSRQADWLGSSRLRLKSDGSVYGDLAYAPFGETYAEQRRLTAASPDRHRTCSPARRASTTSSSGSRPRRRDAGWCPIGRPAAVDITNPQTWNRYAYVGNNPLSNIDPVGFCPKGTHQANSKEAGAPLIRGFRMSGNQQARKSLTAAN